jgi:PPP family 3-phenylpropionic acid transporter
MGSGTPPEKRTALNVSWIDSTFVVGIIVIALGRLALASYNAFFSLYLIEELDWHAIGAMSALSATVEIPMMLVAWKFMRKHSPMMAVAVSSLAIIARLAIYAVFPTRGGVVGGQLLHSLCYGLFQPASVAFVNLKTPPAERTTGMALLLGFGIGLPAFLGSVIGGAIVDVVGYRWMYALFSLFAIASVALYKANAAALDSVR